MMLREEQLYIRQDMGKLLDAIRDITITMTNREKRHVGADTPQNTYLHLL